MTLDDLIKEAQENVQYHERRLQEEQTKLDAYYTARDAKADNPLTKWEQYILTNQSTTSKNGESGSHNKSYTQTKGVLLKTLSNQL